MAAVPATWRDSLSGVVFLTIPGGAFRMGSTDGYSDETPVHAVTVPAFRISLTEVTVAQYRACVDAGACEVPGTKKTSRFCNWGYPRRDDQPINCASWNDAQAFVALLSESVPGARLPTEAEWEYAARSGGNP